METSKLFSTLSLRESAAKQLDPQVSATKLFMHGAVRDWLTEHENEEAVVAVHPQKNFTRKPEELLLTSKEAAEIALAASAYIMNQPANDERWVKAKAFAITIVEKAQELKICALEEAHLGPPCSPTFCARTICEGLADPSHLII